MRGEERYTKTDRSSLSTARALYVLLRIHDSPQNHPRTKDHHQVRTTKKTFADTEALTLAVASMSDEEFEGRILIGKATWTEVAELCAYSCQMTNLRLKPWETPPCHADEKNPWPDPVDSVTRFSEACRLLRKMLAAGISRWHPDPMKALEHAERKKARRRGAR
jgi:hypothetical protein